MGGWVGGLTDGRTDGRTYVRTYVGMYLCMYVCTYVYMYVYMYVYVCMCVCIYVCMYIYMYVRIYVCMCVGMYVCPIMSLASRPFCISQKCSTVCSQYGGNMQAQRPSHYFTKLILIWYTLLVSSCLVTHHTPSSLFLTCVFLTSGIFYFC